MIKRGAVAAAIASWNAGEVANVMAPFTLMICTVASDPVRWDTSNGWTGMARILAKTWTQ
jgi:hypothetical protein